MMAIPAANRPKGRSVRNLKMVWAFAAQYRGHIACAAFALRIAAAAATSIP
jgi:ATP-binding cassette subfamily B protein